ncbi:MAG: alpha/beta hydrolase [Bacteroidales bacterium]|nr:alpha/beta hydrolase [Bacteroidales bacterium]
MKKLLFVSMFMALFIVSNAQSNKKIEIGTIDTLNSKILNEKRAVWVYVPNQQDNNLYSKQHYPVVYLFDGGAHFYSVVGMTHQLSTVNGNTICPEMIVVGINNTNRTRDLTPTIDDRVPNSGGNEKLISFIEKELIPYIDSTYPTEPYRMLIGHSYGGLAVVNTLINHTNLFNSYIAIDPSMSWKKQSFLKDAEKVLAEKKYNNVNFYLGIANTMVNGMDTIKVKQDTTQMTSHIRSILELANYTKKNRQNELNFQFKYYSDDNHGSVPLITEYDALHFIFSFYNFNITYSDFMDTTIAFPVKIEKHYKEISQKMGYSVKPPEGQINNFGYSSLNRKSYSQAEYFFKLNVENYPESYNVYDSLGDYYVAVGDKSNAIIYFQKSLAIKEIPITRQKLEKLQGK